MTDFHKTRASKLVFAWANAWGLFRRKTSPVDHGCCAAVVLAVHFEAPAFRFIKAACVYRQKSLFIAGCVQASII